MRGDPMVDWRWLTTVIIGLMLMKMAQSVIVIDTGDKLLSWMLMQQVWLIYGSLQAVRQIRIWRWDIRDIGRGALVGTGLFATTTLINLVIVTGLSSIFSESQVQQWFMQERLGIDMLLGIENAAKFWLAAAAITIGASVSEELFFRGALLTALRHSMPAKWAIIIGALSFALVHFYLIQFIPVLLAGIVLGLLFVKSNNLMSTITAHLTVNALAFLVHIL